MKDVRVLSTAELQQGLDRDSGLHILNVQTDQFFAGELIPGSRRIALDRLEDGVKELPKVIVQCSTRYPHVRGYAPWALTSAGPLRRPRNHGRQRCTPCARCRRQVNRPFVHGSSSSSFRV